MSIKQIYRLAVGILLLLLVGLVSCNRPISIKGRMNQFQDDLNNDPNSLYLNLYSGLSSYNTWKSVTQWNSSDFAPQTYSPQSFSGMVVSGDTVTGNWSRSNGGGDYPFKCRMQEDGIDGWFIVKFEADYGSGYQPIIQ